MAAVAWLMTVTLMDVAHATLEAPSLLASWCTLRIFKLPSLDPGHDFL